MGGLASKFQRSTGLWNAALIWPTAGARRQVVDVAASPVPALRWRVSPPRGFACWAAHCVPGEKKGDPWSGGCSWRVCCSLRRWCTTYW